MHGMNACKPEHAFVYAKAVIDAAASQADTLKQRQSGHAEGPAQLQRSIKLLNGLHQDVQEFLCEHDPGDAGAAAESAAEVVGACRAAAKALGLGAAQQEPGERH